jgi:transketolase
MAGETETERLEKRAREVRRDIIFMIQQSGTAGHYGGALSCVEVLTCLFFRILRHRPTQPSWVGRDRFILSKGHAAPALYAILAECGYFSKEQFATFKKMDGLLQGHPDMKMTPGVEMSTGSLGMGLSVAVGMALASRMDGKDSRVYVLLGDGELDEGSVWEAAMAAAHYRLGNITAIIDRNLLQISGSTEKTMRLEPLSDKWRAFGWAVCEINGHDIEQLLAALDPTAQSTDRPSLIVANTVKGKGIHCLENKKDSHSALLTDKEAAEALAGLEIVV